MVAGVGHGQQEQAEDVGGHHRGLLVTMVSMDRLSNGQGSVDSMVERGPNHRGMDGVVTVVTPVRAGSHNSEGSSSDESLHFCSIGV